MRYPPLGDRGGCADLGDEDLVQRRHDDLEAAQRDVGADKLIAAAEKRLGIAQGQTTRDGNVSLMAARCVGACSRAPVVLCDGVVKGEVTGEQMLEELERWTVA